MFEQIPVTLALQNGAEAPPPPTSRTTTPQQPGTPENGAGAAPAAPPADSPGGIFGGFGFVFILLAIMIVFMIMSGSSQRKERKRREAMIAAIKKGDRIQTVGGIRGTLLEVRDDEVIVKVDENANTRLRFARSAVQNVLQDEPDKVT